jgi:hypothetical protein
MMAEIVADAQDEDRGYGDLALGEVLLEGLDEIGSRAALFGGQPGDGLDQVVEGHLCSLQ